MTKWVWTRLAPLDAVHVAIGRLGQFGWVTHNDQGVGRDFTGEGDKAAWAVTMKRSSGEAGVVHVHAWWVGNLSLVRVEWDGPDAGIQAYIDSIAD